MRDKGEARAAKWLAAWDAQGIHRTAMAGDEAGADWLIREAAALGAAAPACEEFALDRLDPIAAYLEVDGVRIAGCRYSMRLRPALMASAACSVRSVAKLRLRSPSYRPGSFTHPTTKGCGGMRDIAGWLSSARVSSPVSDC
jgi:hypothetical protein